MTSYIFVYIFLKCGGHVQFSSLKEKKSVKVSYLMIWVVVSWELINDNARDEIYMCKIDVK